MSYWVEKSVLTKNDIDVHTGDFLIGSLCLGEDIVVLQGSNA